MKRISAGDDLNRSSPVFRGKLVDSPWENMCKTGAKLFWETGPFIIEFSVQFDIIKIHIILTGEL